MSSTISFSGLGSGMDYSSWIDALVEVKQQQVTAVEEKIEKVETQQTAMDTIKSQFTTLNSKLSKFTDCNLISAFDMFSKKSTTVSDDSFVTATAENSAAVQSFTLSVSQLATPTVVTGMNNLGKLATMDTKLTDLNSSLVEKGKVSIYVNNQKSTFEVTEDTTLQDFCDFMEEKTGGTMNLSPDGVLSLDLEGASVSNIELGSTSDDGNLLDFFSFTKSYTDDNPPKLKSLTAPKVLTEIDLTGKIMSTANLSAPVTAGTFKIGNQEFTIDENTSISGIIYQINSNSDSGVTASYDAVANNIVLKAKEPGSTTINIEAGTSNFTEVVGWTTADGSLAEGSQELGKNSKFTINDKSFEAATNTISPEITGITGLTLNLKRTTREDEPVDISIQNDTSEVESAIEEFIEAFNTVRASIKEATDTDGYLAYDSTLRSMSNELSNIAMNIVPGLSKYISFSTVGISTGKASTDVSNVSTDLVFDVEKFRKAMNDNPDEVKKLFINDVEDSSYDGVMVKLKSTVNGYLDYEKGYFAIKSDSYEAQLSTLEQSLTRKQESVDAYRARLEKQFQSMDTYISELQSVSSYISSISSSSSSSS